MQGLFEVLHTPPREWLRRLSGAQEHTVLALRPLPPAEGTAPLPGLGAVPYTLPELPGTDPADPLLVQQDGRRWLLYAAGEAEHRALYACPMEGTAPGEARCVLQQDGLAAPVVFAWAGQCMLLCTAQQPRVLRLYRAAEFPTGWEPVCDLELPWQTQAMVVLRVGADGVLLQCSEASAEDAMQLRPRRAMLREEETGWQATPEEAYNLQQRAYGPAARCAGAVFEHDGQAVRPVAVNTQHRRDSYLQFLVRRGNSEVPMCAATPQNIVVQGVQPGGCIGVAGYARDAVCEVLTLRLLREAPKGETTP